jgi:tyrosyl-tRNA synthetase
MSFTEFSYQLVQGYDFLYLYENIDCKLQMGGSDQWGNIVTGTELIRRKRGGEAYALTCPLITKADGEKFGKTEEGNVWLNPAYTSPYKFYQFWINVSDEDAARYIRIFTLLERKEIEDVIKEHEKTPHLRILQKRLAREVTTMVHSGDDYQAAVDASEILFGKGTSEALAEIREDMFLSVFEGVPRYEVGPAQVQSSVIDLLCTETTIFPSKGELRRMVQGGGLMINKQKVTDPEQPVETGSFLNGKYLLVQKGKKNYYLITLKK